MAPAEAQHVVISPVAGTFYRVPAPGERPHVEVGDAVEAGRELCSIHTMEPVRKAVPNLPADYAGDEMIEVHHMVVADVPGEVVEVLVEEAGEVERGRPLFRLRPEG